MALTRRRCRKSSLSGPLSHPDDRMRATSSGLDRTGSPSQRSSGLRGTVLPGGRWNILAPELLERLAATPVRPPATGTGFVLINSRQLSHNCSASYVPPRMTRDRPVVSLNPDDANGRGIADGALVRIASVNGQLLAAAFGDASLPRGVVTISQGWAEANVSNLCAAGDDVDPLTAQPAFTGLPVSLELVQTSPARASRL